MLDKTVQYNIKQQGQSKTTEVNTIQYNTTQTTTRQYNTRLYKIRPKSQDNTTQDTIQTI